MNTGTEGAAGIGHNSAPYNEVLREEIETVLGDDHEKLFHFAKWHIDDYIAGTVGMQLETEGAYMRFLMRLYQRGKPLPDDDRYMSICMSLSIRVWRRIKDVLIGIGKILRKNGCLTNARFERERKARAEQLRKQADATRKRWERERQENAKAEAVSTKLEENSAKVSAKLSQSTDEKSNEINGSTSTQVDITRVLKSQDKKDSVPNGTGADAPDATLREMVWNQGIAWLRPRAYLDEAKLRTRVGGWVRDFGPGAVLNAIAVAQRENPVSAMSYVEGVLKRGAGIGAPNVPPWEAEEKRKVQRQDEAIERLKAKYSNGVSANG